MKSNSMSTSGMNLTVSALGILAALLVFPVFTGRKVPLPSSDQAALLALVTIGMLMCSQGGIGCMSATGA